MSKANIGIERNSSTLHFLAIPMHFQLHTNPVKNALPNRLNWQDRQDATPLAIRRAKVESMRPKAGVMCPPTPKLSRNSLISNCQVGVWPSLSDVGYTPCLPFFLGRWKGRLGLNACECSRWIFFAMSEWRRRAKTLSERGKRLPSSIIYQNRRTSVSLCRTWAELTQYGAIHVWPPQYFGAFGTPPPYSHTGIMIVMLPSSAFRGPTMLTSYKHAPKDHFPSAAVDALLDDRSDRTVTRRFGLVSVSAVAEEECERERQFMAPPVKFWHSPPLARNAKIFHSWWMMEKF